MPVSDAPGLDETRSRSRLRAAGTALLSRLAGRPSDLEALTRSERRFRLIAEDSADLILLLGRDVADPVVAGNVAAFIGHEVEEIRALLDLVHPDDRAAVRRRLKSVSPAAPRDAMTLRLKHKDGRWLWVEAKLRRIDHDAGATETLVTLRDISDRTREAEELREATLIARRAEAAADEANKAKTEFLACMSHEIRTPLNSIVGFVNLMLANPALPGQIKLFGERIQASADALLTIVDDILDFSRVEAGVVELKPAPFALPRLLDSCLAIVQQTAKAKNLAIHVNLNDRLPRDVMGDEARLRQILLNLLNNAIKFTEEGSVLLDLRFDDREAHRLRFSVIDTGIGIARGDLPKLFERFAQVDNANDRVYGGTGLGLAICKRLVELMDGRIGVDSEKEVGSTFWFEVCLPPTTPAAERQAPPAATALEPKTILLVEDVAINQDLVCHILESGGHRVDVVGNGAEAIMAVLDRTYDLVLMDVQMPYMDGLAATKAIRRLPAPACHVRIVGITANVMPEQIEIARRVGMQDVIHKPFSAGRIFAALANATGSQPVSLAAGAAPIGQEAASDDRAVPAMIDKLASLIGGAKVEELLRSLAQTLETQFRADVGTDEGRALWKRQAHAAVAGSGMLGFTAFAAACRQFEQAGDEVDHVALAAALRMRADGVIAVASNLGATGLSGSSSRRSSEDPSILGPRTARASDPTG